MRHSPGSGLVLGSGEGGSELCKSWVAEEQGEALGWQGGAAPQGQLVFGCILWF